MIKKQKNPDTGFAMKRPRLRGNDPAEHRDWLCNPLERGDEEFRGGGVITGLSHPDTPYPPLLGETDTVEILITDMSLLTGNTWYHVCLGRFVSMIIFYLFSSV